MPETIGWNRQLTVDSVIQRLYEVKSLFNRCNRSYDGLVKSSGTTSVSRPRLAQVVVKKNTAFTRTSSDRKKTKDDTRMVTTPLDIYTAGILSQLTAEFESNDMLRTEYEKSMVLALQRQFDVTVLEEAIKTTNQLTTKATGVFSWADIVKIDSTFNKLEVPEDDRLIVLSADLEEDFWDIDVIKTAAAFRGNLETGKFLKIKNMDFYISAKVPKIGGKACALGIYGPGLAFILNRFAEIKEVYDPDQQGDVVDLLCHAGCELDGAEFAVAMSLK